MGSVERLDADIFTVADVLSAAECAALIERAEALGFAAASVATRTGPRMLTGIRNNDRVDLEDDELRAFLWERVRGVLPPDVDGFPVVGLHHRLRFYRYDPGQRFKRHRDGRVTTEAGEVSRLTLMFYLNDGYAGGETTFRESEFDAAVARIATVTPAAGMALAFVHERWHEGTEVRSGRKYVLCADVLYAGAPNATDET